MELLTKTEEKIMQIVWKLKKGFVNDMLELLPAPKPAYNTISTIVRKLEEKGFVDYKAYGRTYEYFPIITKFAYRKYIFKNFIMNYFDGSYENVVSYMVADEALTEQELQEIKEMVNDK